MPTRKIHSQHFFARETDGSVRLRIRWDGDDASLIEEAAGEEPLMEYIRRSVSERAQQDATAARQSRPHVAPPQN